MNNANSISRRAMLKQLPQGLVLLGLGGFLWGTALKSLAVNKLVLRPPGALPETEFLKACLKCGQCVSACPYDTLKLASFSEGKLPGTPYFEARKIPCYLCADYPCIRKCPTEALSEKRITLNNVPSINHSKMGIAHIHKNSCIAYKGIHCSACYRACPLKGKAILLVPGANSTMRLPTLQPVIDEDICTGCGLCEHHCIMEEAAIKVLPLEMIEGKVGEHFQELEKFG